MTPDERERMTTLCQRIATEQDRSVKDHRLEDKEKKNDLARMRWVQT